MAANFSGIELREMLKRYAAEVDEWQRLHGTLDGCPSLWHLASTLEEAMLYMGFSRDEAPHAVKMLIETTR